MEKQSTRKFLKLLIALVALFLLAASALMLASCKEHVHQYELDESKSTNATCSQAGSQTFVCPECGDIYVNVVPATGQHTWQETKVYPASCESEGWTVFTCSVCSTQKQDNWTPKLTHKYEVAETHEATCTTDGYQIFECSFCGDRYTDSQYTAQHPKLGHDWIVNETAEKEEDRTDADGWKVVKAANCLEAGRLERECARCGEVESKKGADATGHKVANQGDKTLAEALEELKGNYAQGTHGAVCNINKDLVDAEGNAVYAFECVNENCPVNVVVDNRGNEKHYIKAVDHKMEVTEEEVFCVDSTDKEDDSVRGKGESYKVETCEVCGTEKKTDLEATGHDWNTIKFDGKTPVVSCEADTDLDQDEYLDYMRASLGDQAYSKVAGELLKNWNDVTKGGTVSISRVCATCGELDVATGHDYVVAKLQDGKYGLDDYEKDENGLPVEAEGVTLATMDCRYVQVCANGCGTVVSRGAHGESSDATCRDGGRCEICGEQTSKKLQHIIVDVADLISDAHKTSSARIASVAGMPTTTWKQAYDAYVKVSATETWMTPVKGSCEAGGTNVQVCIRCLMDAANGAEFDWTTNDKAVTIADGADYATNDSYCATVVTTDADHDYQPVYFSLSATDLSNPIDKTQANCEFGFKLAYVCTRCDKVYMNVPVGDNVNTKEDPDSTNETPNYWVESRNNKDLGHGYTDSVGFILDIKNWTEQTIKTSAFTIAEANKLSASNNVGTHSITIDPGYYTYNGYKAPTCIEVGIVPVKCSKCGANLSYTADELETLLDSPSALNEKFELSTSMDSDAIKAIKDLFGQRKDNETNASNHAGTPYACGTHCDVKVFNASTSKMEYACTGFVKGGSMMDQADIEKMSHSTIAIDYLVSTQVEYYEGYSIQVATIGTSGKLADATLSYTTKISMCANNTVSAGNVTSAPYEAPSLMANKNYAVEGLTAGTQYLVLVDANKNVYPFYGTMYTDVEMFTEDGTTSTGEVSPSTTVTQNDTFFVKFSASVSGGTVTTVTNAPVTVVDDTSLKIAQAGVPATVKENGKDVKVLTVKFGKNAEVDDLSVNAITGVDRIVYDLNGNTVTVDKTLEVTGLPVVVQNGTLKSNATTAVNVGDSKTFTLTADLSAVNGEGIAAMIRSNVTVNGATITAKTYGIRTQLSATTSGTEIETVEKNTKIDIDDTTINMNVGTSGAALNVAGAGADQNNTALYVGVPSTVTVDNSTFTANRQAVVVRAGNVTLTGTTLNLAAYDGKTGSEIIADDDSKTDPNEFSTVIGSYDEYAYTDGFVSGFSENTYRLFGAWGDNNNVPHAAVVAGNSNTTAWQQGATVVMNSVTINLDADDTEAKMLVVGSKYSDATAGVNADGTPIDEEEGANVMVYVRVTGGTEIVGADFALCYNYISNTATVLGAGGHNGSVE